DLAFRSQRPQVVAVDVGVAVFAGVDVSPGRDRQVVGEVEHLLVVRLDEKFETPGLVRLARLALMGARDIAQDLTVLGRTGRGAGEVERIAPEEDPFAPAYEGGARLLTAQAQVRMRVVRSLEVDPGDLFTIA